MLLSSVFPAEEMWSFQRSWDLTVKGSILKCWCLAASSSPWCPPDHWNPAANQGRASRSHNSWFKKALRALQPLCLSLLCCILIQTQHWSVGFPWKTPSLGDGSTRGPINSKILSPSSHEILSKFKWGADYLFTSKLLMAVQNNTAPAKKKLMGSPPGAE